MLRAPLLLLLLTGALVAAGTPAASAQGVDPDGPNPLLGVNFYVDHDSPSWHQWQAYTAAGDKAKADLIWKIAREPKGLWLGRFTRPNFAGKVRRLIDAAKAASSVPLFTVLRAEATSCGPSYQGGGPAGMRPRGPGTTSPGS